MASLNLRKKGDCSQSTRVEREKRDRREREGWWEGGEQKGENPLFSIEDQETTGDKSARQTATQPQTKLKGWPDPACSTNVSPYKHFGWSSWINSVLKLSQGKIIRACAIAVLDNRSMRFSFRLWFALSYVIWISLHTVVVMDFIG